MLIIQGGGALRISLWFACAVLFVASGLMICPASAQTSGGFLDFFSQMLKGTPEEEAACKPDVTKYCQDATPDTFRVLGCLKDHRRRLSKACLAVLESHGQ
jgi:hypothetical protein